MTAHPLSFGNIHMESGENDPEIGFLRIDGNGCQCYNDLA